MKRYTFIRVFALLGLVVMAVPARSFVGQLAVGLGEMQDRGRVQVSFSGDATLETEEMTTRARVYYSPGKVRDEINMGGQEVVMIRRFDLNKLWMLLGQGMYMDVAADQMDDKAPEYRLISREKVGREMVNGMETTKYKSVYESSDGKFGGFTWFTDDNIAVKAFIVHQSKGEKQRMKFEFTRLERGRQDDDLFELPPGAKPLNMSGMMSGYGQMPDQGGAHAGGSPGDQGQSSGESGDEDSSVAEAVAEEAKESAVNATLRGVSDSVSRGIGKLFGK